MFTYLLTEKFNSKCQVFIMLHAIHMTAMQWPRNYYFFAKTYSTQL